MRPYLFGSADRHYHSSYCAVAGLMDHRFTGEGPLHSEEWQVVAEQSSYWADRWEAVREFKNLKALPEWSKYAIPPI